MGRRAFGSTPHHVPRGATCDGNAPGDRHGRAHAQSGHARKLRADPNRVYRDCIGPNRAPSGNSPDRNGGNNGAARDKLAAAWR